MMGRLCLFSSSQQLPLPSLRPLRDFWHLLAHQGPPALLDARTLLPDLHRKKNTARGEVLLIPVVHRCEKTTLIIDCKMPTECNLSY